MSIFKMTAQEVYDAALFGIRGQGYAPSKDPQGTCVYRGPNGLKCAAGHALTDKDMVRLGLQNSSCYGGVGLPHVRLVAQLQRAHDAQLSADGAAAWEGKMRDIAHTFDLTYTPPSEGEA